jgi:hypothetical protein
MLGLALFAVFAFSVVAVASASALESVWLVNGHTALVLELVLSEGELSLSDLKVPFIGTATVLCSGLNEGFIGGDASGNNPKWDEVTKITGLNATTEPLWIVCTIQAGCETGTTPEAMPVNLPWLTELLLVESKYLDDLIGTGGNAGWIVRNCLVLGLSPEDECTKAETSADIDNGTNDVIALFSEAISGHAMCSQGGAESGDVVGEVLIFTESGEPLAVSEGEPTE